MQILWKLFKALDLCHIYFRRTFLIGTAIIFIDALRPRLILRNLGIFPKYGSQKTFSLEPRKVNEEKDTYFQRFRSYISTDLQKLHIVQEIYRRYVHSNCWKAVATGESGTPVQWSILKTYTCIIIVSKRICRISLKVLLITMNIRFLSEFLRSGHISMPHKLYWRNVYSVNQHMVALNVSQLSGSLTERSV